jgi:hypothetical protein
MVMRVLGGGGGGQGVSGKRMVNHGTETLYIQGNIPRHLLNTRLSVCLCCELNPLQFVKYVPGIQQKRKRMHNTNSLKCEIFKWLC